MPLKIPKPQGFSSQPSDPSSGDYQQLTGSTSTFGTAAPPTIRVQRFSPGESEDVAEAVSITQHAGLGGKVDAPMDTTSSLSMIAPSESTVDASHPSLLLTPPNTAKIVQPQSADVAGANIGVAGLSFQTQSTPASPGSPLTPLTFSPSVSKRGRTSAVSLRVILSEICKAFFHLI